MRPAQFRALVSKFVSGGVIAAREPRYRRMRRAPPTPIRPVCTEDTIWAILPSIEQKASWRARTPRFGICPVARGQASVRAQLARCSLRAMRADRETASAPRLHMRPCRGGMVTNGSNVRRRHGRWARGSADGIGQHGGLWRAAQHGQSVGAARGYARRRFKRAGALPRPCTGGKCHDMNVLLPPIAGSLSDRYRPIHRAAPARHDTGAPSRPARARTRDSCITATTRSSVLAFLKELDTSSVKKMKLAYTSR